MILNNIYMYMAAPNKVEPQTYYNDPQMISFSANRSYMKEDTISIASGILLGKVAASISSVSKLSINDVAAKLNTDPGALLKTLNTVSSAPAETNISTRYRTLTDIRNLINEHHNRSVIPMLKAKELARSIIKYFD